MSVLAQVGERMAATSERNRIVCAQLDGPPGQTGTFGNFLRSIDHPAIDLAPEITPGRHRIGRGEIRIAFDHLVEQGQRFVDGRSRSLMQVCHAAQIVVVSGEVFGRLALRAPNFCPLQLRCNRADNALGYLILQLEGIIDNAFAAVCPKMPSGCRIDELGGNAHPVGCSAHAAFQQVTHAQLAACLFHVHSPAFIDKA